MIKFENPIITIDDSMYILYLYNEYVVLQPSVNNDMRIYPEWRNFINSEIVLIGSKLLKKYSTTKKVSNNPTSITGILNQYDHTIHNYTKHKETHFTYITKLDSNVTIKVNFNVDIDNECLITIEYLDMDKEIGYILSTYKLIRITE